MPGFKRTRSRSSSVSSSNSAQRAKRAKSSEKRLLPGIKVYIVQAKLASPTIARLFRLAEAHTSKLCKTVEEADVVITAITMRKRLERHVPPNLFRLKYILTPEWLQNSVKQGEPLPYTEYAALGIDSGDRASVETDVSMPTRPASPSILDHTAKLACQRASPLVCINQGLVSEINVIRRSRELEGESRSMLSYARAIAAIKSCPFEITSSIQALDLPYIGPKISHKIGEYLDKQKISEAQTILRDPRYHILDEFASIYGIGTNTARDLYAKGARTIDDLKDHYKIPSVIKEMTQQDQEDEIRLEGWIDVSLALIDELSIKIPRREVEMMCEKVFEELNEIQSGCSYTIVGGYRRGKPESNDVDVVFTHPDANKIKGLCKMLTERLVDKGFVTHLMSMSGFSSTRSSHTDVVEKALTVFSLPGSKLSRRLDLIFTIPEAYWTAIVGWSGSTMFERDLRIQAKSKNMKFDSSGITHRDTGKRIPVRSEQEVFEVLGLEWVDPTLRNADA